MDQRLKKLRKYIDIIDKQILDLLENRMNIVKEVGDIKHELDLSIEDIDRENQIIKKLTNLSSGKLSTNQLIRIFTSVFKSSKQIQRNNK